MFYPDLEETMKMKEEQESIIKRDIGAKLVLWSITLELLMCNAFVRNAQSHLTCSDLTTDMRVANSPT